MAGSGINDDEALDPITESQFTLAVLFRSKVLFRSAQLRCKCFPVI